MSVLCVPGIAPGTNQGLSGSRGKAVRTSTADGDRWTTRLPDFPLTMRISARSRSTSGDGRTRGMGGRHRRQGGYDDRAVDMPRRGYRDCSGWAMNPAGSGENRMGDGPGPSGRQQSRPAVGNAARTPIDARRD